MKLSSEWRTRFTRSLRFTAVALAGLAACAPLRGPTLAPGLPRAEPSVRVGILVDTTQVQIGSTSDYELRYLTGRVLRALPANAVTTIRADAAGRLVVTMGQDEVRAAAELVAAPIGNGLIAIDGKPYRGTALIRATGPGRVTAVNQVDMENYLLGVVPYEIGRVGPELIEAAKAQAVAARTYALRYLGRRADQGFDVFATVQDQVYGGAAGEHEPVSRAVRETAGQILTYAGEPIEAYYHSTCAGQTAAIQEVWPWEAPKPYLVSVVDVNPRTGEAYDASSSRFHWTQRWTGDELRAILNQTLADSLPSGATSIGELRDLQVLQRTQSQRIRTLRITTSVGTFDVGGDRIRWIFLTPEGNILNSSRFDLVVQRDPDGEIEEVIANGMGWGHGIGMCQVGAMGRARAGQDYRTILQTYYPGTRLVDLY